MTNQSYKVKLTGKSQLHEPVIKLESIQINLWSIDGGVTWENKEATVNVNGQLEVFMSCKAITGTQWEFEITNKASGAKVVEKDGATGEQLPNYAEYSDSVNP
jgi:hypothetical protein